MSRELASPNQPVVSRFISHIFIVAGCTPGSRRVPRALSPQERVYNLKVFVTIFDRQRLLPLNIFLSQALLFLVLGSATMKHLEAEWDNVAFQ